VPTGLELDRGADLLDREACRDGHAELARRDQVPAAAEMMDYGRFRCRQYGAGCRGR
jgi:hypothetical protein